MRTRQHLSRQFLHFVLSSGKCLPQRGTRCGQEWVHHYDKQLWPVERKTMMCGSTGFQLYYKMMITEKNTYLSLHICSWFINVGSINKRHSSKDIWNRYALLLWYQNTWKKSNRYDILLQYTKVRRYNKLNMNIVLPVPSSSILTVMSRISFSAVESTLLKFDMLTVKVVQPSLSA